MEKSIGIKSKLLKYHMMKKSPGIKARITKIESLNTDGYETIKQGDEFTSVFYDWPKIGDNFIFYEQIYNNGKVTMSSPIVTTSVHEIIDDVTFKTKNSIYRIYTKTQEREDKINNILE